MGGADASAGGDGARRVEPLRELSVVCGPTAAGKSAIALALAERHGLAIVSADSRQVYRGFDVGTAKPTAAERARVPHFGIDVAEPTRRYSAAEWASAAEHWLGEADASGREPLVVGGSGLYLRALFAPLHAPPPLDESRRRVLHEEMARLGPDELRRWCVRLDPARAHLGRTQLLRSVETALLTGRRLGDLHRGVPAPAPRFAARYLVVNPDPAVLAARIERRVREMLDGGWVDEVRRLQRELPTDAPAWSASGYGAVRRYAAGELTREDAARSIAIETRQYAKRQRTWFRRQLGGAPATWLDPDDPHAADVVARWWSEGRRRRTGA